MLAIRLSRMGSKKRPFLRVVVIESTRARDSRCVESLGFYRPQDKPATVKIDQERARYWLGVGARPTDTVRSLLARHAPAALGRGQLETPAETGPASEASAQ
jgi:small subunit ribosomal protein S16